MFTLSLHKRLTLALTASLLAGAAATVLGAGHLVALHQRGAEGDFRQAAWMTLAGVVAIANAAALFVAVFTTRTLAAAVRQLRASVLSLTGHPAHHEVTPAPVPDVVAMTATAELQPAHDAVQEARTQIHAMLDRIRVERDRHSAIIDTVFASLFAVDGGGRIIHANAAAARMFDRPIHALPGVVLSDLIATESLRMTVDEFGTVTFRVDADAPRRFSTTFRVFGRQAFPAEVSVMPLVIEGQRAWAVFVQDLSAQQAAESKLLAARMAAEDANRAKTAFLTRVGGEFRTPLDATIGFTQVILRSRSSQLSERDRHLLEKVEESSAHLRTLLGDILDLARIETGMIALATETTDVTDVVHAILTHFDEQVAGRPILLERDYPEMPLFATVDPARLRQVLTNLVSNALKFTARGTITVSICRTGDSDRATAVIVRDTGIGIPLERQSDIFDLFAQSEHETTARHGSVGLGLALSKRLSTEMGCMLSVESMPGAGSAFTLTFAPTVPVSTHAPRALASQHR